MNNGWTISHHLPPLKALTWTLGIGIGKLLQFFTGREPMMLACRRGEPFFVRLRLQWLALEKQSRMPSGDSLLAPTVQLLGSTDDIVSPQDNVDLQSGRNFVYLDIPNSGHTDVVEMDASTKGRGRASVFLHALTASLAELRKDTVLPSDSSLPQKDDDATDVVFVVHGIRDEGHWTQKIAREVIRHNSKPGETSREQRKFVTETSRYGYFPMLPFLFPSAREEKVRWLVEQYVVAKALYPGAKRFSYIGHSNGTYLLAEALERYRCLKFDRVVFAGSVVRRSYPWTRMLSEGRVTEVLNYVATTDWVVAWFPKWLGFLKLGSAGHDGFSEPLPPQVAQIQYIRGGHSAALQEDNWKAIAAFIVDGRITRTEGLIHGNRHLLVRGIGWIPLGLFSVLLTGVAAATYVISRELPPVWASGALLIFLWTVWNILTRA